MPAGRLALAAAAAAALLCAALARSDNIYNSSEILAQSLRRQLMKDNYDYMSTESEETSLSPDKNNHNRKAGPLSKETFKLDTVSDREEQKEDDEELFNNIPKWKNKLKAKDTNVFIAGKSKHQISPNIDEDIKRIDREIHLLKLAKKRKKLQRSMNDINEDVAKRYISNYTEQITDEDNSFSDANIEQTTTVKYKVLKLKSPYRRSGDAAALIQEESPDGVSIVNLGAGPIPEIRLPRAYRQYMQVPQPLKVIGEDEEELPPPLIDTTPEDTNTRNEKTKRTLVPGNSLKITVTPDEILIL